MEEENNIPEVVTKSTRQKPKKTIGGVLLRLLFTFILAVILGGVIYYTAANWIPFFGNAGFQPGGLKSTRWEEIQSAVSSLEKQLSDLEKTLEGSVDRDAEQLSDLLATQTSLNREVQDLSKSLDSLQETADINQQIMENLSTVYPQMLSTLTSRQAANSRHIEALATAQMAYIGERGRLDLLRILDLLSRSNQFLLHSNLGLAKDTLQTTKEELTELQSSSPGFQQEYLSSLIDLVEGAADDLPENPDLAADKIELAWQKGIEGLPQPVFSETSITITPTPYSPDFTPTPTPP